MFRSLKGKILSIYIFLILLISLVAVISILNLYSLNKAIDGLIASNYKSIAAATNMIDAIERQDSNQLIYLEVDKEKGISVFNENEKEFLSWLDKAQANITEANEKEIIDKVSSDYLKYIDYFSTLQEIRNTQGSSKAIEFYDNEIYPVFNSVKNGCKSILSLNESAMFNSKDRATVNSRDQMYGTVAVSLFAVFLGLFVSVYFTRKATKPIYMLISGIKSIKRGNLNQEIKITTRDEIGELATEFNNMTGRLLEYDKSSVKNLIAEKNKSLAIVKSISDPIVVVSNDYRITLVNKSAENVFNILEKEVLGGHFLEAIGDRKIYQKVKGIVQKDIYKEDDNEPIAITKRDKTYYYVLTVTSVLDDDKKINGIVCVFKDITHLKEVEQLKSDFISTVSHELRTPLTSIIMGTKLLLDENTDELTSDQKEIIQAIDEDGGQLMLLVNDLLDLSRAESGKMQLNFEAASIYNIVELCIKQFYDIAEDKGIRLIHEVSQNLPLIFADCNKIKCVVNNLIVNALKFTDRGGMIKIRASVADNSMRVSVKDTGQGIPKEFHDKIFDKFTQVPDASERGGTGLGLAIAREFIKKHNGEIWVESKPGEGSSFIFTLPLYEG